MNGIQSILARLQIARKQAGLSQSQVSKEFRIGQGAYADIESNKIPLSVEMMLSLCDMYEVSAVWMLTGRNPDFNEDIKETIDNSNMSKNEKAHLLNLLYSLKQRGIDG